MFVSKYFHVALADRDKLNCVSVCLCVSQIVMDEAYKLIVHIYHKHLIQRSQKELKNSWSPNVGETVTEDAELLHDTISDLVRSMFGINHWKQTTCSYVLLMTFTH